MLAFDIGGTKLASAVVAEDGSLVGAQRTPTARSSDGERLFADLVALGRASLAAGGDVDVVSAGCGGPMRWPEGVVSPLHIPAWRGFPLRERLAAEFGVDAVVDNDAKAFAYGEWWRGAGRGSRAMLGMVVSTGVGGGIVIDGRLIDGAHGHAGHIGHVNVDPEGPVCSCGARGCLTAFAAGTGIARRIAAAKSGGVATSLDGAADAAQAAAAARAGDAFAAQLFRDAAEALGRAIASAVALLDLDLVVIGGSVALGAWDLIGEILERELRSRARSGFIDVKVMRAALGADAGLIGAAALVYRPTDQS